MSHLAVPRAEARRERNAEGSREIGSRKYISLGMREDSEISTRDGFRDIRDDRNVESLELVRASAYR